VLVKRLQVDNVKVNFLRERLGKPQHKLEADGVVTKLWEVDKKSQFGTEPTLNGKGAGTLLVAVVPLAADNVLVGTAFVTAEAGETYAPLVMQSVQSLAPVAVNPEPAPSPSESPSESQ